MFCDVSKPLTLLIVIKMFFYNYFNLKICMNNFRQKNHPKLYLWSKPWEKPVLPEKRHEEHDIKPKKEIEDEEYSKNEIKSESQHESMIMMMLKEGKEDIPKIDINSLMETNTGAPIIPRPEAAINSADCRLNLLDHIRHQEMLVEERLDEFENQIEVLEDAVNMNSNVDDVRLCNTLQMLMRDLETLKEFSQSTTI